MAQHVLHSKEARDFGIRDLLPLTEGQAELYLAEVIWGCLDKQACPACGSFRAHYRRPHRKQWRCAEDECGHHFSVTSSTMWHKHKLSYKALLLCLMAYEASAKGVSSLQLSRLAGITPKSASVFLGKMRESIVRTFNFESLKGVIHMDGGHFCGKLRRRNKREKKPSPEEVIERQNAKGSPKRKYGKNMQWSWKKLQKRRVVLVLCQSASTGGGSDRTIPIVCASENSADAEFLAAMLVDRGATIMTDEGPAFSTLGANFVHKTVNHQIVYCTDDGVSDNMAETAFSRIRRAQYGTFHGYRPKYLQDFAMEMAWREDCRRQSQQWRLNDLLKKILWTPRSDWWRGYWQGRHRDHELGINYFRDELVARFQARVQVASQTVMP